MKTVAAIMLVAVLLIPGVALASSATDAALGLGAFAVFNQIISGTGIFGGLAARPVVVAPQPVYVAPPQPVYVAPPQPVYVVPPPPPYYGQPVVVAPPVYGRPGPVWRPVHTYAAPTHVYHRAYGHRGQDWSRGYDRH
jgi:hypothetical protein